MSQTRMDVVIRGGIMTGLDLNERYEVRLGPCPWVGPHDLMWRISEPVTLERALALAQQLLREMQGGYAFEMPPEFHIVGRLEPATNYTSGGLK